LGQWEPRYALHASRQLSGEVLRYLKQLDKAQLMYFIKPDYIITNKKKQVVSGV